MNENSTREAVDFMLKQFKPERYAYLAVSVASFILLIICVILFISGNKMDEKNFGYIAGMVGAGGAIAYTASQLLRMWRDCMELFSKNLKSPKEDE
jgi:hypothetical protein